MGAVKSAPMAETWRDWNWKRGVALLLSAAVHIAVAVLLLSGILIPREPAMPPSMTVELVPERPKPPPPKPEPPKPDPPKEEAPKPEAPKPEPPKPEPKPPEPPKPPPPVVKPPPPPPPPRPWYEMDKPVLEQGKLAKKSVAVGAAQAIALGDGPSVQKMAGVGEASQSERDLLLGQIIPLWKRSRSYMPPDGVVQLRVLVQADGSLGAPFTATDPWNPAEAIANFNDLPPGDPRLSLLVNLYNAVRLSQPLRLPPEMRAKAPFAATLDFRLADIP